MILKGFDTNAAEKVAPESVNLRLPTAQDIRASVALRIPLDLLGKHRTLPL